MDYHLKIWTTYIDRTYFNDYIGVIKKHVSKQCDYDFVYLNRRCTINGR